MIKIGDKVKDVDSNLEYRVVGILLRGRGYREYECMWSNREDKSPMKAWMPPQKIREIGKKESSFGFKK
jgi:hypothetical protein